MTQITYEIKENLGVLSQNDSGWKKEFKIISWNSMPPKYDIRDWSPDGVKMGKGQTFTKEEMQALIKIAKEIDI